MAFLTDPAQQVEQARRPSPGLNLNLSSNNPFRNPLLVSPNTLSPALVSPSGLPGSAPARSPRLNPATNPFLAPQEQDAMRMALTATNGEGTGAVGRPETQTDTKVSIAEKQAEELFQGLSILDNAEKVDSKEQRRGPKRSAAPPVRAPPTGNAGHKLSLSDEPSRRRDPRMMRPRTRPNGKEEVLDIFASPERRPSRRMRRNSESSIMSKGSMTEEERRRRDRRRKESGRPDASKERSGSKERDSSKSRPPRRRPRGMDLIDRLDQTGIYGAGFIHHDGPFDAANPHRNRRKDDRAPMRAFPAGSANMIIGGSGPVNKGIDLERFHGVGAEGFTDYAAAADSKKRSTPAFDPLARVDPVHGEESYGLGTSTFLEGAPASRKAILRRESETQAEMIQGELQRKKSLAHRLRVKSRPQDRPPIGARMNGGPLSPPISRIPERLVQSAGGPSRIGESNPFDKMYDDAFEQKGAAIKIAEQQRSEDAEKAMTRGTRERAPSSPLRNGTVTQRTIAGDSGGEDAENKPVSGFLNRVRSMKGGRRGRQIS